MRSRKEKQEVKALRQFVCSIEANLRMLVVELKCSIQLGGEVEVELTGNRNFGERTELPVEHWQKNGGTESRTSSEVYAPLEAEVLDAASRLRVWKAQFF